MSKLACGFVAFVCAGLVACGSGSGSGGAAAGDAGPDGYAWGGGWGVEDGGSLQDAAGGGQGGSTGSAPICDAYLACAAEVEPAGLAAILAAYGKDGSCWAQGNASLCEDACRAGIVALHKIAPGSAVCNRCSANADCPTAQPACDTSSGKCAECGADNDCKDATKPACDVSTHTCVTCTGNTHCSSPAKPVCDAAAKACVGCLSSSDCLYLGEEIL